MSFAEIRPVLDLSAPRPKAGEKLGDGVPLAVNGGIDKSKYTMEGLSAQEWIRIVGRAGKGAVMSKCDYESAYKHIQVRISFSFHLTVVTYTNPRCAWMTGLSSASTGGAGTLEKSN